jgi:O-antigen ligase
LAGSLAIGYEPTMRFFCGDRAYIATQGFTRFQVGPSLLYRIPSTFSFVTQYFCYTLTVMTLAFIMYRTERNGVWRSIAITSLALFSVSCFLSGARAGFIAAPVVLSGFLILDGHATGVIKAVAAIVALIVGGISAAGLSGGALVRQLSDLGQQYTQTMVYDDLLTAAGRNGGLGSGTGTNTGSARYAFSPEEMDQAWGVRGFENYYAKAAAELGVLGLILCLCLHCYVVSRAWRLYQRAKDRQARAMGAGLLMFFLTVIVLDFKGSYLDLDPINMYFWIMCGLLFRLERVSGSQARERVRSWAGSWGADVVLPVRLRRMV